MSGVVVLDRSGIRDFLGIQAPPEFGISFPKSTILRNMLSADAHHESSVAAGSLMAKPLADGSKGL